MFAWFRRRKQKPWAPTQEVEVDAARSPRRELPDLKPFVFPTGLDADGQPIHRGFNEARRRDRSVHELLGMIKGILADGIVTRDEVIAIGKWMLANCGTAPGWPVDVVAERLSEIFGRGEISPGDCENVRELFAAITAAETRAPIGRNSATRLPLTQPPPVITIPGRLFVFTGKFLYGTRSACEQAVIERGGFCQSSVSQRTDVLVVGWLGSEDWMHTNFGRKIEAAVENVRHGAKMVIIAEEHWATFL